MLFIFRGFVRRFSVAVLLFDAVFFNGAAFKPPWGLQMFESKGCRPSAQTGPLRSFRLSEPPKHHPPLLGILGLAFRQKHIVKFSYLELYNEPGALGFAPRGDPMKGICEVRLRWMKGILKVAALIDTKHGSCTDSKQRTSGEHVHPNYIVLTSPVLIFIPLVCQPHTVQIHKKRWVLALIILHLYFCG